RGASARPGLWGEIDAENTARIAAMSPEEVEEARRELELALPPATIETLRRRGQAKL
ncbi:unnamed protein product, partial [Phaeothamnion confervicola]